MVNLLEKIIVNGITFLVIPIELIIKAIVGILVILYIVVRILLRPFLPFCLRTYKFSGIYEYGTELRPMRLTEEVYKLMTKEY